MTYNRSQIMRSANAYAKTMNRGEALRKAWKEAKTALHNDIKANATDLISAADIRKGDILKIEYGRENNWVVCIVTDIADKLFYGAYLISAVTLGSKMGISRGLTDLEFCAEPDSEVRIYNKPAAVRMAA